MMLLDRLELRDREVLRTLARLRYVTTRQLIGTLFPSDDVARRRLKLLSGLNLVRPHTHGLPPGCAYHAWRLTADGVQLVHRAFPSEPVPDGLVERLAEGSLANAHHREALVRLYLLLVVGARSTVAPRDPAGARAWARLVRTRAEQFTWAADGDVVLRYATVKPNAAGAPAAEEWVIPDATVVPTKPALRLFVELDRSTHKRARVRDALRRYKRFFAEGYGASFPDQRTPHIVLVVPSEARRRNLTAVAADVFATAERCTVLTEDQAPRWMAQALGLPELTPPETTREAGDEGAIGGALELAARDVYTTLHSYRRELRIADPAFDFPAPVKDALRRLHVAAFGGAQS